MTASTTSALVRASRLESKNIEVTTEAGGVLALQRSSADCSDAEQACWAVPGVTDVVNDLNNEY